MSSTLRCASSLLLSLYCHHSHISYALTPFHIRFRGLITGPHVQVTAIVGTLAAAAAIYWSEAWLFPLLIVLGFIVTNITERKLDRRLSVSCAHLGGLPSPAHLHPQYGSLC
jgi:hypothetical protein